MEVFCRNIILNIQKLRANSVKTGDAKPQGLRRLTALWQPDCHRDCTCPTCLFSGRFFCS